MARRSHRTLSRVALAWLVWAAPQVALAGAPPEAPSLNYTTELNGAWQSLQLGDLGAAERRYRLALALQPESEDAALGLSLVMIREARWGELLQLTEDMLRRNPGNRIAALRRGLAHFSLGEYERCRAEYAALAEDDPEDSEASLGLGYCLARLGQADAAGAACSKALEATPAGAPADPRALGCMEEVAGLRAAVAARREHERTRVSAELYGAYLTYSDPWDRADLRSAMLVLGLRRASGFGLGLDLSQTDSSLRYTPEDERQRAAGVDFSYERPGGWIGGHAALTQLSDETSSFGVVGAGRAGFGGRSWRLGLEAAASLQNEYGTLQAEPWLALLPSPAWTLSLAGRWIGLQDRLASPGQGRGAGQGRGSLDHFLSGSARVRWAPWRSAAVALGAWLGERRYPVDGQGRVASGTGDRFTGGLRAELGVDLATWLSGWLALQVDRGDQQLQDDALEDHDFLLYGAVLGITLKL